MILVGSLARLGALQNPLLPFLREREVGFITGQTGARFLVVPRKFRNFDHEVMARAVAAQHPGLEVLVVDGELPDGDPSGLSSRPSHSEAAPVRWIFYSSGTTADPKGARHTDPSVAGAGRVMCQVLELVPGDRSALVFPFTHIGGINWQFA